MVMMFLWALPCVLLVDFLHFAGFYPVQQRLVVSPHLYDLLCYAVLQEIADQSPAARPLRRRAGLLIGQWVGKLKGEDRPLAYRALLSLLADPDPAMQLAAVASLHALVDDWSAPNECLLACKLVKHRRTVLCVCCAA